MPRVLRTTLITGLPIGVVIGLLCWSNAEEWWAFAIGLCVGLLVGLMIAALLARRHARMEREAPAFDGERLLKHGPANHFRGFESVGGWLYLTARRLEFRPHSLNVETDVFTLPLSAEVEAETCLSAGLIPNGLIVRHPAGEERFVVYGNR